MTPAAELLLVAEGIPAVAALAAYRMHLRAQRPSGTSPARDTAPAEADVPQVFPPIRLPASVPLAAQPDAPLTTRPVAKYLGVHERTVTHWADSGLLTATWQGGKRVYTSTSVQARKAALNGGTK